MIINNIPQDPDIDPKEQETGQPDIKEGVNASKFK